MKVLLIPVSLSLIFGSQYRSSISLHSPLVREPIPFPGCSVSDSSNSPYPPSLLKSSPFGTQSNDWTQEFVLMDGHESASIAISAFNLSNEGRLIEEYQCDLLVISDRRKHRKSALRKAAAKTMNSYFTANDRAFDKCSQFVRMVADPEEWFSKWWLVPFVRSLTAAIDHLPDRHLLVQTFQRLSANPTTPQRSGWLQLKTIVSDFQPNNLLDSLSDDARLCVVEMWFAASLYLLSKQLDELTILLDHPKWKDHPKVQVLKDTSTSTIDAVIPGIKELFRLLHCGKHARILPLAQQLDRDLLSLCNFKADLSIVWRIMEWNRENSNGGHIAVNLLHYSSRSNGEFDFVVSLLEIIGFERRRIQFVEE